jgi:hypothetical protein
MPSAEANAVPSDLRARIASAGQRVDLEALVKAGGRSALVLSVGKIEGLVREAVERALASRKDGPSAAEVQKIEADAKRRLEELLVRHREVLSLKSKAEESLLDLSRRIGEAGAGGSVPDLDALSRQVAAMASLLRGEAPTASAVGEPIKALLGGLGGSAQGDERLDRILFQLERLAAAVEATEKKMRAAPVPSAGAKGAPAPAAAPPLDLFRAILEENLKLASPGLAAGGS